MGPWMVLPVKVYELNITHSKFLFALWLLSTKCLLCLLLKIHHVSADDVMWREDMEDVDKWGFAASDSFDYVLKWGESGCKSPSHVGDNVGTWSCDMWLQLLQSLQLDCVELLHLQLVGTPLLAVRLQRCCHRVLICRRSGFTSAGGLVQLAAGLQQCSRRLLQLPGPLQLACSY